MRCYSNFLKDGERRIKEIFCIKRVKLSMFKLNGHESVKKDRRRTWRRYCTMSAEGSLKGENRWPPRHKRKVPPSGRRAAPVAGMRWFMSYGSYFPVQEGTSPAQNVEGQ